MPDERFRLALTGDESDYLRALARSNRELSRFAQTSDRNLQRVAGGFNTLRRAAIAAISALGVREVAGMADRYQQLDSRIRDATRATGDYSAVSSELLRVSLQTGTALENNVELYQRISTGAREIGATSDDIIEFTENIQKLGQISGANVTALAAGSTQLAQGLGAGVLRAEEFNSVVENLPSVAEAIAAGMNMTVGELRRAVLAGEVLSSQVMEAILSQSEDIDERFSALPLTLARAQTNIRTAIQQTVGQLAAESGALGGLAQALDFVANNMETIVEIALTAAYVVGTVFAARAVSAAISALYEFANAGRSATAALAGLFGGPIGVGIGLLSAGLAGLAINSAEASAEADRLARLQTPLRDALGISEDAADNLSEALAELSAQERALATQRAGLRIDDLGIELAEARQAILDVVDDVVANAPQLRFEQPGIDLQGAIADFEADNDFGAFLQRATEIIESFNEGGEEAVQTVRDLLVAAEQDSGFSDLAAQLSETEQALGNLSAEAEKAARIRAFLRGLGDDTRTAGQSMAEAIDFLGNARDALARARQDLERAELIEAGDVQALAAFDQRVRVATAGSRAFSAALSESGSFLVALQAAYGAAAVAQAEFDAARRGEIEQAERNVRAIEAEIQLRELRALGLDDEADAYERSIEVAEVRNQLIEAMRTGTGRLTAAQIRYIEQLTAELDQTIKLEQAQEGLAAARDQVSFGEIIGDLQAEIYELQREEQALLAGAEAWAAYTRQRAIQRALDAELEDGGDLGLAEVLEIEQAVTRLIDLQSRVSELRSNLTSSLSGGGDGQGAFEATSQAIERQIETLGIQRMALEEGEAAAAAYRIELELTAAAIEDGLDPASAEVTERIRALSAAMTEAQGKMDAARKGQDGLSDSADEGSEVLTRLGNVAGNTFGSFITGATSAEQAATRFLQTLAEMLIQILVIQPLIDGLTGALSGGLGGGGGGPRRGGRGGGGGVGDFIGSLVGGLFGGGRAEGGRVLPGRMYTVGERGPEPFIPLEPGVILPNDALRGGGGGGGNSFTLNAPINAAGADPASLNRVEAKLDDLIARFPELVRTLIAQDVRAGGAMSKIVGRRQ